MQVTSTEFQQNLRNATRMPLGGTDHHHQRDRPHTVLMSAALFEVLVKGRVARKIEDLDADTSKRWPKRRFRPPCRA